MWFGLGTVVETEDAFDYSVEFFGEVDGTGAAAILAGWMLILLELDTEGGVHCGDSACENYRAAGGACFFHREVVGAGEGLDESDAGGIGSVLLLKILAAKVGPFADRLGGFCGAQGGLLSCAGAETDSDLDLFVGVGGADFSGSGHGSALAAGEGLGCSQVGSPFRRL